jgi:transposase
MKKTNTMKFVELKFKTEIRELLTKDYVDNKMTMIEMAEKYQITYRTLQQWMNKLNIPRRKITFV